MTETLVGEPFLLSSYGLPPRLFKSQKNVSSIYAAYEKVSEKSEGHVTVAAQGDGVHVLDVRLTLYFVSEYLVKFHLAILTSPGRFSYSGASHDIRMPTGLSV